VTRQQWGALQDRMADHAVRDGNAVVEVTARELQELLDMIALQDDALADAGLPGHFDGD
jgi:hypothetical protein